MSFLAGRLAASEGAYFSQTSKETIARLREKAARSSSPKIVERSESASLPSHEAANADVLPEILRHTLPEQQQYDGVLPSSFSPSPSSLAASLAPSAESASPISYPKYDSSGLLAFLPRLPQASFGPRRWKPSEEEVKIWASTANEARMEGMSTIDDEKAKALVEGYSVVMKAFLIASGLVVGGTIVATGVVGSKLQIHSLDDIRIKGHEYMQPRVEAVRESFEPWKGWVQERSRDWSIGNEERNTVSAPFTKVLGLKQAMEEEVKKG